MKPSRIRLFLPLALALLALADCGGGSKSSSSNTSSTASTASKAPSNPAEVKAATEECKRIVGATSQLTQGAKEKLEGACAEAAKGNLTKVKEVAKEVCEEVVNKSSSKLPAGAKEKALEACKKA